MVEYGKVCACGSMESGGGFGGRNLTSVAVKMFSHSLSRDVTNVVLSSRLDKIKCINVRNKRVSFPSTLTGDIKLVFYNSLTMAMCMMKNIALISENIFG
jgi:hypothetical protein